MSRFTTYLNLAPGLLPGCVGLGMVHTLICALPRPRPGGPLDAGRQMIQDALGAIDAYAPRDAFEAKLIARFVAFGCQADHLLGLAMAQGDDLAEMLRCQRQASSLTRCAAELERLVRQHRTALAAESEVHVSPPQWEYDLDALEVVWRDLTAVLPAEARRERALVIPEGLFGSAAPAEPQPVDADEAVVPEDVPPVARVPLWKRNGRRHLDELSSEELRELVLAAKAGTPLEEPPVRPDGMRVRRHPDAELVLTQAQIDALTPEQRRERYGVWGEGDG